MGGAAGYETSVGGAAGHETICERIALRNSNAALGRAPSAHLRKAATVKTGLSFSPSPASTTAGTAELDRGSSVENGPSA